MELNVREVSVRFGALTALADVSLAVSPGRVVALIGPNGAGKTTLLNVISGLVAPQSGTVSLGDTDLTNVPPHQRARRGIGRTFQHARLMDDLGVMENVLTGAYPKLGMGTVLGEWIRLPAASHLLGEQETRAASLLSRMGLGDVEMLRTSQISFGRKKLIDLARALISNPSVLLMDEPTAGLSEKEIARLVELVQELRRTMSVVLVAHHMGFVSRVADEIVCLVAGRVLSRGAPAEVQRDPAVLAAYMGTS